MVLMSFTCESETTDLAWKRWGKKRKMTLNQKKSRILNTWKKKKKRTDPCEVKDIVVNGLHGDDPFLVRLSVLGAAVVLSDDTRREASGA